MSGFNCFIEGFSLVLRPVIRRYFIIPTLINVVVLIGLIAFSWTRFDGWVNAIMGWFPDWMSAIYWLIWTIALIVIGVLVLFGFTFIANIISSPFNALLSIKVEEALTGKPPVSSVSLLMILPRSVGRELAKLLYTLPRLIGLLILTVIPVLNVIAPVLWVLFGAWMMALQYADYAADNNDVSIADLRQRLGKRRLQSLLFGLPAYLLLTVPVVNLVLMPVGVAGGTRFWVQHLRRE